jgi:membrane-associated protease RseP (regulator of RpoE activity)
MSRVFVLGLLAVGLFAADPTPPTTTPPKTPTTVPAVGTRAWLGVSIDQAGSIIDGKGLAVLKVDSGSPAAVMGIKPGDRLIAIGGAPLKSQDDLKAAMSARKPGDQVTITILRGIGTVDSQQLEVKGALQQAPRSGIRDIDNQLRNTQEQIAALERKVKEPTLAELAKQLAAVQEALPKAAAEFKRLYPKGEFRIAISIEITSDASAQSPLTLDIGGTQPPAPAPEAVPEAVPAVEPPPEPTPTVPK